MEGFSIIIFILITLIIFYSAVLYVTDLLLKKRFQPNEEYLVEIKSFRPNKAIVISEFAIIIIVLLVNYEDRIIILFPILVLFELMHLFMKLRILKSKEKSRDTIKFLTYKTLIFILLVIISVIFFFWRVFK